VPEERGAESLGGRVTQALPVIWVRQLDETLGPLSHVLAKHVELAIFRHNPVSVASARGDSGANLQRGDDSRLAVGGSGGEGNDGLQVKRKKELNLTIRRNNRDSPASPFLPG